MIGPNPYAATKFWLLHAVAVTLIQIPFGKPAVGFLLLLLMPFALLVDWVRSLVWRQRYGRMEILPPS